MSVRSNWRVPIKQSCSMTKVQWVWNSSLDVCSNEISGEWRFTHRLRWAPSADSHYPSATELPHSHVMLSSHRRQDKSVIRRPLIGWLWQCLSLCQWVINWYQHWSTNGHLHSVTWWRPTTDQVLVRIYMSEEDPTKCPPLHHWSSCHTPTNDGSVCLATAKCPVCPVIFRAPRGHCSPLLGWALMKFRWKMSYMCPTSVLLLSDYLPVAPIILLLVRYQHHLGVTNWNVSNQYPTKMTKWKICFPTSHWPL